MRSRVQSGHGLRGRRRDRSLIRECWTRTRSPAATSMRTLTFARFGFGFDSVDLGGCVVFSSAVASTSAGLVPPPGRFRHAIRLGGPHHDPLPVRGEHQHIVGGRRRAGPGGVELLEINRRAISRLLDLALTEPKPRAFANLDERVVERAAGGLDCREAANPVRGSLHRQVQHAIRDTWSTGCSRSARRSR
jgi:hypothetical protein